MRITGVFQNSCTFLENEQHVSVIYTPHLVGTRLSRVCLTPCQASPETRASKLRQGCASAKRKVPSWSIGASTLSLVNTHSIAIFLAKATRRARPLTLIFFLIASRLKISHNMDRSLDEIVSERQVCDTSHQCATTSTSFKSNTRKADPRGTWPKTRWTS